tara:strand:- start:1272 stop:1505 length:234 start_codon:yes stop_codon:yes gene_type:complete
MTIQTAPILDFEMLQQELVKVWKLLPEIIGPEEFIEKDINECAHKIMEGLIYDYWRIETQPKRGDEPYKLNYTLAEA